MLVNAIFFFSYIACRIIFMGLLLLRNYQIQKVFDIFSDPPIVAGCAIISTMLQVGLYLIQLYWFKLIFGAFMRTMQGSKPTIASKDE